MSREFLSIFMFFLIGFSWIVYLVQDMFIIGASALNRVASSNEEDRKKIQVITGMNFDGIEVWLIASLSLLFAIFPIAFATILTYLYVPFFLLVFALIFRGVSIEVIYKLDNEKWVRLMVMIWTISSLVLIFILGIYISNIFLGFPLENGELQGSFFSIFNTTGISGGLFFLVLSLLSGAAYIDLFVGDEVGRKAMEFIKKFGVLYIAPILLLLVFMGFNNTDASIFIGELFGKNVLFFLLPILAVVFSLLTILYGYKQDSKKLFIVSILAMIFFLVTGFVGSFPNIVPSRIDVLESITIEDSVSTKTMSVIFWFLIIFYPLIMFYQGWKYKRFMKVK